MAQPVANGWTEDRLQQLGMHTQQWLKQYTEAAVQFTTALLTAVTRFVLQVVDGSTNLLLFGANFAAA